MHTHPNVSTRRRNAGRSTLILVSICLSIAPLSGCITRTNVTHVEKGKDAEGIYYYLPSTYLKATPGIDGSVDVETVYMPNPSRKYAINIEKYLASYTVDVTLTREGFLDKIIFNGDSSAVAETLLNKAAEARAAEIDAQQAADKAAQDKLEATTKEMTGAISTAETAVRTAQLELELAGEELDFLQDLDVDGRPENYPALVFAARLAVQKAERKVTNAEQYLEELRTSFTEFSTSNAGKSTKEDTIPGPSLFYVDMRKAWVDEERDYALKSRTKTITTNNKTVAGVAENTEAVDPGEEEAVEAQPGARADAERRRTPLGFVENNDADAANVVGDTPTASEPDVADVNAAPATQTKTEYQIFSVRLEKVEPEYFETWTKPKPRPDTPDSEVRVEFSEGFSRTVRPRPIDGGALGLQFKLELSSPMTRDSFKPDRPQILLCSDPNDCNDNTEETGEYALLTRSAAGTQITVDLPSDLPEGSYVLPFEFGYKESLSRGVRQKFDVRR